MKIGRGLAASGGICWFAASDGTSFQEWDPRKKEKGRAVEIKRLLAPATPGKIIAVGLNYRDHAQEMRLELPQEPILFMKPSTSVIGPDDAIVYPRQSSRVDYEAELAVVIAKTCRDVRAEDARDVIFGYTCLNDVTARDLQVKDGQWTRAKSFDTFAPIGPWIETTIEDPGRLAITSRLNGQVKQSSNTHNLIFNVFQLVEFISSVMTLQQWDIIATGTPAGVGPMERGDEVEIEVEGIGTLRNSLV